MQAEVGAAGFDRNYTLQFDCPQCGVHNTASVPQVVDLLAQPEQRKALVQQTLHLCPCAACDSAVLVRMPVAIWEPLHSRALLYLPQNDAAAYAERSTALLETLRRIRPEATGIEAQTVTRFGELADLLLEGFWDRPEEAGLQAQGVWRELWPKLARADRQQLFELLAEAGDTRGLMAALEKYPRLQAAIRRASDPDKQIYTDALETAILSMELADKCEPERLIDTLLVGLVECARAPQATAGIRNRLHAAVASASRRLSTSDAPALAIWCERMPEDMPAVDAAIAWFNIAGGVFDRTQPPRNAEIASALIALLDAALRSNAPPDLAAMILDRRGELLIDAHEDLFSAGAADFAEAAKLYQQVGNPQRAFELHCELMRRHISRSADDPQQRDAALDAGGAALSLAQHAKPQLVLELAQELAQFAWHATGDGRESRLDFAADIYRAAIPLAQQLEDKGALHSIRFNLANVLLDNRGADATAHVEEALTLLEDMQSSAAEAGTALEAACLSLHGTAYKQRTIGDRAENLERAIGLYRAALSTAGSDATVLDIARYNLANTLIRRLRGTRRENLLEAWQLHKAVLDEREREQAHRQLLMRSNLALGNVLYETALLSAPADSGYLQRALVFYRSARSKVDAAATPSDAARVAMLEGQAHAMLPDGAEHRQAALDCFDAAEELAKQAGDIGELEDIWARRGSMLFRRSDWLGAVEAYQRAFEYRRRLSAEVVSGIERQRALAGLAPYAARLAYALAKLQRLDEAIAAFGGARAIDLRLARRAFDLDADAAQRYRSLRAALNELESRERADSESGQAPAMHELHRELAELREELERAGNELMTVDNESHATGYASLRTQLAADELLAIAIVTDLGSLLIFAAASDMVSDADNLVWLDDFKLAQVRGLLGLADDPAQIGWKQATAALAAARNDELGEALSALETSWQRLNDTSLVHALRDRLHQTGCSSLRMLLHAGMQVLPLQLAGDASRKQQPLGQTAAFVQQVSTVSTAASAHLMGEARPRVLVLADPTGDLPYARFEAALIADVLGDSAEVRVLAGEEASAEQLLAGIAATDILHFAGHATHDWEDAMRSSLLCADGYLSVAELRAATRAAPLQLVVLSACQSGLADAAMLPDEFIGLPGAFFALGAAAVVSSLWVVQDEATALLMGEFYAAALQAKQPWARALMHAQHKLAHGTAVELNVADALTRVYEAGGRANAALARRALLHRRHPNDRPYAHPVFWGAHTLQLM